MWDFIGTVVVEVIGHLLAGVVSEVTKHDGFFWGLVAGMVPLTAWAITLVVL